eukprot:gnl/TRDRNA2_/TRDRNA2_183212_c0_seq1.p1 gnl/TRDRNA2_/TRDRNA2_183212_c0~~gnl/TRDRNA2_/TRDRNA2_183212_c0_seq1.p1  ORF type:complete len:215 (+),score=39.39 gnl/TRDRNA2_/TRDRNA2_183212_c0_seq1:136-780(+)
MARLSVCLGSLVLLTSHVSAADDTSPAYDPGITDAENCLLQKGSSGHRHGVTEDNVTVDAEMMHSMEKHIVAEMKGMMDSYATEIVKQIKETQEQIGHDFKEQHRVATSYASQVVGVSNKNMVQLAEENVMLRDQMNAQMHELNSSMRLINESINNQISTLGGHMGDYASKLLAAGMSSLQSPAHSVLLPDSNSGFSSSCSIIIFLLAGLSAVS